MNKKETGIPMYQATLNEPHPQIDIFGNTETKPSDILKEFQGGIVKNNMPAVKQRAFIGIDNGVSGSIGIVFENGTYQFHTTPTKKELNYTKAKAYITRIKPVELTEMLSVAGAGSMVMIERPMVNPTRFQASVSAIRCFEATITVLETLGLPYECIDSKKWQKELLPTGTSGEELKTASMDVGNRLYPEAKAVKHTDRDGMLIAHYCRIKYR